MNNAGRRGYSGFLILLLLVAILWMLFSNSRTDTATMADVKDLLDAGIGIPGAV